MMILNETLIQIVASGGSLIINLEEQTLLSETMIQLALTASRSGAHVTFKLGKTLLLSETMIQIALAGKGSVTFDLN